MVIFCPHPLRLFQSDVSSGLPRPIYTRIQSQRMSSESQINTNIFPSLILLKDFST